MVEEEGVKLEQEGFVNELWEEFYELTNRKYKRMEEEKQKKKPVKE